MAAASSGKGKKAKLSVEDREDDTGEAPMFKSESPCVPSLLQVGTRPFVVTTLGLVSL